MEPPATPDQMPGSKLFDVFFLPLAAANLALAAAALWVRLCYDAVPLFSTTTLLIWFGSAQLLSAALFLWSWRKWWTEYPLLPLYDYLPRKTRWFWAYIIGTFPASLALAFPLLREWKNPSAGRQRTAGERFRASLAEYDAMTEKIRERLPETERLWIEYLNDPRRTIHAKEKKRCQTDQARMAVLEKAHELEELQRKYFALRLGPDPVEPAPAERLRKELNDLVRHPSVKAIEVGMDRIGTKTKPHLKIYTDTFTGPSGEPVGPFIVKLVPSGLADHPYFHIVSPADKRTKLHPASITERDGHCFGAYDHLIDPLLRDHRFAEAAAIMFQAFESPMEV